MHFGFAHYPDTRFEVDTSDLALALAIDLALDLEFEVVIELVLALEFDLNT
jgi:hypothetical protein